MILNVPLLKDVLNFYVEEKLGDFSGEKDYAKEAMHLYMKIDFQRRKKKSNCKTIHVELNNEDLDNCINIFSDLFDLCLSHIKENKGVLAGGEMFVMLNHANSFLRKFKEHKIENMLPKGE